MKKISLIVVVLIVLVIYFYPKPYTSSPGMVPRETYEEFSRAIPTCYGYSHLTNREATFADAPGKSLCFGWLAPKAGAVR